MTTTAHFGPATNDDLRWPGAAELATRIRRGDVTARDALEAQIERIERLNPAINAVVSFDLTSARAQADEADGLTARGMPRGPLHGVGMTVKDLLDVKGLPSTAGTRQLAGRIAGQDSEAVRRLREAGAIIIGKTNTPALGQDMQCISELYGRTNNPWNLERTPGGSSGGAAAALAAGLVPLELGTDASGSLRVPAHCCGVYAHKPTYGTVSIDTPPLPLKGRPPVAVLTFGPMARSVADLALAMGIIGALAHPGHEPTFRVAWTADFLIPSGREVRGAIEYLAEQASASGMNLTPLHDEVRALTGQAAALFMPLVSVDLDSPDARELLQQRELLAERIDQAFGDVDAWLLPVMPIPAPLHSETGAPIAVDGELRNYWETFGANTSTFNVTGQPATALPIGLSDEGLPIGVQLVGRRGSDRRLLDIAAAFETLVRFNAHPDVARRSPDPSTTHALL